MPAGVCGTLSKKGKGKSTWDILSIDLESGMMRVGVTHVRGTYDLRKDMETGKTSRWVVKFPDKTKTTWALNARVKNMKKKQGNKYIMELFIVEPPLLV